MKDWNPAAPARSPCSRKHMSEDWKSSSLPSTQIAVFGREGMLPMTPITPYPPSNMEVETLCFAGVFLLRGQDNHTASKGRWTGPCTVRARALKTVRALKMGRGWVFQHDNDPKHTEKTQTADLCGTNKVFATKYKVIFCEGVKYLFDSLKSKSMYNFFEMRFSGFFCCCSVSLLKYTYG